MTKHLKIALLTGSLVWLAELAPAGLVDGIQAVVHDAVITYNEVSTLNQQTAESLFRLYGNQPDVLEAKMNQTRVDNLETLVDWQLILPEFKTAGYSLPESVLDDLVQERIRSRYRDRVTLTKTLQEQGLTYEDFRKHVREQFIVEQLRLKNISQEIIISPHKVEAYYAAHRDDYKVEDQVKLRMIVLDHGAGTDPVQRRKLAEEILGQLGEGASFAQMASVYSQEARRSQGGEWPWEDKSALRKELSAVAFTLKPGQRSGVIETPEACYIMEVEDARTARVKPLGEVRDQIEKELLTGEKDRLEKQWIEKLKKKTFIRTFS